MLQPYFIWRKPGPHEVKDQTEIFVGSYAKHSLFVNFNTLQILIIRVSSEHISGGRCIVVCAEAHVISYLTHRPDSVK